MSLIGLDDSGWATIDPRGGVCSDEKGQRRCPLAPDFRLPDAHGKTWTRESVMGPKGDSPRDYRMISFKIDPNAVVMMRPLQYPESEIYHFAPLDERVPVFQKPFRLVDAQRATVSKSPAFSAYLPLRPYN